MKRIISAENYLQLQELTTAGNYRLQLGFALAGLTYKIENGNVKFYLKDDYFYKNVVWSADLPLNINGTYYDEETIGKGMKNLFDPSQAEVSSVNGKKGDVVLTAGDVNAYTKAETDNLIANEASARQNGDNMLSAKIETEQQRATSAEQALQSEIDTLSDASDEVKQSIAEIKEEISYTEKRITNVVAAINDHNTAIENIEENIDTVNQSITEIKQSIGELENDIDALNADNTTNKADIQELKSDVSELKEKVGKLEADAANYLVASNIKSGANIEVSASGNDVTISATGLATDEELTALEEKVTANAANIAKEVSDRTDADNSILTVLSSKANVTDLLQYINGVSYDSATKHINFNNGGTVIAYVDATDFIKDGMVDSVAIDNGNLVITFNTDAGKEPISIDITEIFNPDNYYTKVEVENALAYKADSADLSMVATSGSYNDLKDKPSIPTVPENVSEFTNDAGYVTDGQLSNKYYTKSEIDNALEAKQDASDAFSGDYNDLTNKPSIPTVPTNVSVFTNDAGYVTDGQLSNKYYTKSEIDNALEAKQDASDAFSGSYNDLKDKPSIPTVPTNVSAFTNDAGYLTEHQSLDNYYTKKEVNGQLNTKQDKSDAFSGDYNDLTNKPSIPTVPTNVSVFTNDAGYLTEHQSLDNYYTKEEVDDAIAEVDVSDQLQNYYTKEEVNGQLNTKQDKSDAFSGDYNDLTNKPVIPVVPTNVSEFTNDAGYLTKDEFNLKETAVAEALNKLKETKADKSELSTHINNTDVHFSDGQKEKYDNLELLYYFEDNWNIMPQTAFNDFANDYSTAMGQFDNRITANENAIQTKANMADLSAVATSGSYNDLKDKPSIPTVPENVSAFNNDAGYLTEHQSLNDYYKKSETYSKTEINQAIADVDVSDQLQNYYTKEESDNKFAVKFTDVDDIMLVNELPSEPKARTLYLIPVQ